MRSMFPSSYKGMIFEVGACGPIDLSNSRLFIEDGWNALLIEPSPAPLRSLIAEYGNNPAVQIFAGALGTQGEFSVSQFDISDGPLSTNIPAAKAFWDKSGGGFVGGMFVPVYPPSYFAHVAADILSVDTEGNSFAVAIALLSKLRFRPKVLCVEREENDAAMIQAICDQFEYRVMYHEPSNGVNRIFQHNGARE